MQIVRFQLYLLLICGIVTAGAQEQSQWTDYWEKPIEQVWHPEVPEQVPDLFQSAALVWIRIYQKSISSQDLPSCVFHPSCSRFAFGAIERFGPVKGILLAGDRLLRCNPFAHNYYKFDGEKFSDPVERYDLIPK
ncbi:MAG: membrane protein insertion efficiency factor YidD [Fidelibacterota bacterium]